MTREYWAVPLLESLGYRLQYQPKAEIVEGQSFAISHRAEDGEEKPPIHIIGSRLGLEKRPPSGTPRLSAHALMQEYLNCTEHLWGIVTNGLQWRLLRDCSLMTRLSYVEFDLEQILNSENYAEFSLFYRLFHRTRLPEGMDDGDKCLLEFYHQQTLQQGGRVRDRLRDGVEEALKLLGTGFLQHPHRGIAIDSTAVQEEALLSIKVCDPACGSGHFLLAAARRLGKELAKIRTNEAQPGVEPIRQAIRDVIQNCIYGVDFNPLAVDLCKVALWIEGFNKGKPLSFLDHRIRCGNSLVGVLDLDCLQEGIPDEAYKAVTGDSKQLAADFKKRNKKERGEQDQLSIWENLDEGRSHYAQTAREISAIAENTTGDVKHKQTQYRQSRQDASWWRDHSACNLWTAAFFTPLTAQKLQLLPTTAALSRLMRQSHQEINFLAENLNLLKQTENQTHSRFEPTLAVRQGIHSLADSNSRSNSLANSITEIVDAANKLAKEKRFFHWKLEFPEVFENGGFSCVLGNPPWERIKLQEKEFFASRSAEIANAANKAAREKLIKQLSQSNPELLQDFEDAKHDAEAQSKFIRESSRFPLTAVGDINTYAVFAETTRKIISQNGRVGIIVPTGIATDDTCKKFFGDIFESESLESIYSFTNKHYFKDVGLNQRLFSLISIRNSNLSIRKPKFSFYVSHVKDLANDKQVFNLSKEDIKLINPNTLTCPVFRSRTDAELTKKIYQRVPVLENEKTGENPWGISFMRMFDMSNDSGLFKDEAGEGLVPLYEAKMFHQFDHRWAIYKDDGSTRDLLDEEKCGLNSQVVPRYWVNEKEVETKLADKWTKDWLIGWRDITNSTNERTTIASLLPKSACGDTVLLMIPKVKEQI